MLQELESLLLAMILAKLCRVFDSPYTLRYTGACRTEKLQALGVLKKLAVEWFEQSVSILDLVSLLGFEFSILKFDSCLSPPQ